MKMTIEMDRNLWTFILIIVGSILAIGSAYIQYKDKKATEQESLLAKKEAKEANEELKNKTDELLEANRKIHELTNETLKVALGSGYLELKLNKLNSHDYQFITMNNSNYTIYDASIDLIDFDMLIKCPQKRGNGIVSISEKCLLQASTKGGKTNVLPNTDKKIGSKIQFSNRFRHFSAKVHSRNSTTMRLCVFERKDNGAIKMAYRLYLIKSYGFEMIEEKDEIGLSEEHWKKYFFKEVVFNITYD